MKVQKVKKRDGRIVKFDEERLKRAIRLAFKEAGNHDEKSINKVYEKVVKLINETTEEGKDYIEVEKIQDIIEIVLMKEGYFEVAKQFILYREEKKKIREEKAKLLNKKPNKLTDIEKKFSLNAIRLLASRYLTRDEETGEIIESVDDLFKRVAVLGAIPEILYDEKIYDKEGKHKHIWEQTKPELEELRKQWKENPEQFRNKYHILKGFNLNEYHFERLLYAYENLAKEGYMKVTINELLKMLEENPEQFEKARYYVRKFFELMSNQVIMPNTPALVNAGRKLGMLSACFTVESRDSLRQIFETAKEIAIISKMGGGIGINFSVFRPAHESVPLSSTGKPSSGVLSWLELYDKVLDVVKQSGIRRGAGMGILWYWHAEIDKFIHAKEHNRGDNVIANFNLSVGTDEKFWEAVLNDKTIDIIANKQEVDEETGEVIRETKKKIGEKKATEILDEISRLAWAKGDPGMLYFDNHNRHNIRKHLFGIIDVTNPCVTGDTRIPTPEGLIPIKELYEKAKENGITAKAENESKFSEDGDKTGYLTKIMIPTLNETQHETQQKTFKYITTDAVVWKIGTKDTVKIITEEGYEIEVSAKAKIMKENGSFTLAEDLKPGDKLIYPRAETMEEYKGINMDKRLGTLLGWLIEKGHLNTERKQAVLNFSKNEKEIAEKIRNMINEITNSNTNIVTKETVLELQSSELFKTLTQELGIEHSKDKKVPEPVFRANKEFIKNFLSALFTTNKHMNNDKEIKLTSTSIKLLKDVQILLNMFGIKSEVHENRERPHELVIKGYSKKLFLERIGFIDSDNTNPDSEFGSEENTVTVKRVVHTGKQVVYDITVLGEKHIYTPNMAIIKSNCGEEGLYPYESCNLSSINLEKFIKYDEQGNPYFDWEEYNEVIQINARLLDNFIDVNNFPLKKIEEKTKAGRNIGAGLMGLANTLYRLKIPYNTEEGYKLMSKFAEHLTYYTYKQSVQLAKERGTFSYYEQTEYPKGKLPIAGYYDKKAWTLNWDELVEEIKQHGLRNVDVTTSPPTGSVSMIADTSSGIEPNFALAYKKVVTVGTFYYTNTVLEEELRKRGLYSDKILEKIVNNFGSVQGLKEIPKDMQKIFVTSMDIHWLDHIIAQAMLQKWITNSISKTINMPNGATVEDVKLAYIIAHELGCKGLTVYRDGSLDIQVYSTEKRNYRAYDQKPSKYALKILKQLLEEKPQLMKFIKDSKLTEYFEDKKEDQHTAPQLTFSISNKQRKETHEHRKAPIIKTNNTEEPDKIKELLGVKYCPVCWEERGELVELVHEGGCKTCPNCGWSACTIA